MRNMLLAAAVGAVVTATPAFADVPGRGWISSQRVTEMLAKRGYTVVTIEADDGHWEGEAIRRGQRYDFHVDPRTGRLTKMQPDRD